MNKNKGMGGHQSAASQTTTWITPPHIGPALGLFDLDPCEHTVMPWRMARKGYTIDDNGLAQEWSGSIWLNPPYDDLGPWMQQMAAHGNGVSLLFARTEIGVWHEHIWPHADSLFFFKGRLWFHREDGTRADANGGAPSVLIGYGEECVQRIADSGLPGRHVAINSATIVVVGISPSWKSVIEIAITRKGGAAACREIYDLVEQIAPDKVQGNEHYKEKIRQVLQEKFTRIQKGMYSNQS